MDSKQAVFAALLLYLDYVAWGRWMGHFATIIVFAYYIKLFYYKIARNTWVFMGPLTLADAPLLSKTMFGDLVFIFLSHRVL